MITKINKYSSKFTQNETQPASQAMFYGAGFAEEGMEKAQVGIASTGYEGSNIAKLFSLNLLIYLDLNKHYIYYAKQIPNSKNY